MASSSICSSTVNMKIVILGETGVGKSSIVHRIMRDTYHNFQQPTIGAAFFTKSIQDKDSGSCVRLEIWDTAGQERYRSLVPMYTRSANAVWIVVASTSHPDDFDNWRHALIGCDDAIVIKVFSKCDLSMPQPSLGQPFQTSALTGMGINELVDFTVHELLKKFPQKNVELKTPQVTANCGDCFS